MTPTTPEEARRDEVMIALANRLADDIDALFAQRDLDAFESDARLVARAYVSLVTQLEAAQDVIEALRYIARAADDPLPATLREASEYASAALARYDALQEGK